MGEWVIVMPRSTNASIADQTRSVRLRLVPGTRCMSWMSERESYHNMTARMGLIDSSCNGSRQVQADKISASSALMLLHTEPNAHCMYKISALVSD